MSKTTDVTYRTQFYAVREEDEQFHLFDIDMEWSNPEDPRVGFVYENYLGTFVSRELAEQVGMMLLESKG